MLPASPRRPLPRRLLPFWMARIALLSCLGFLPWACSSNVRQAGGLELIVATNLRIPDDLDAVHVKIQQQVEDGGWLPPVLDVDYPMMSQSDLPTRIAIAAGQSPDQVVLIDVAAKLGDRTIVTREAQIQVPTDRVDQFVVLLSAKCVPVICLEGNTCDPDTGTCVPVVVDPGTLPPYMPGTPIDAGPLADVTIPPADASDGSVGPDAGDSSVGPDTAVDAQETGVAEGGIPEASADGEAGATCAPGGTCTPSECQTGTFTCDDAGVQTCTSTGNVSDGKPCGGSGSGMVCHQGACVSCPAGNDCTPPNSCVKKQYDCSTGVAVCNATGNVMNGAPCGMAQFCSDGLCQACTANVECQPTANPCNAGKNVCSQGQATCQDQGTPAGDGTPCGTNMVCHQGSCKACTANLTCTPPSNVCDKGLTDCSTGVSTCPDHGTPDPAQNGMTCASGSVCDNGACNACPAGNDCRPAGTCAVMVDVCTSGAPVCTPGSGSVPDGTSCGGSDTCCGGGCVALSSDAHNCGACGHDCLGGGCMEGMCQPVTLTTGDFSNATLIVDSNNVYVEFDQVAEISYCPKSNGCTSLMTFYVPPSTYGTEFAGFATDGAALYAVDYSGNNGTYLARVTTSPVSGTFGRETTPFVPGNIAFDTVNNWVYLATSHNVVRMKPDATQYATFAAVGGSIAVDSQNLYIADNGNNRVVSCTLTGSTCSMTPVMTVTLPRVVYSDGTYVWATAAGTTTPVVWTLSRCNVNTNCGASPDPIATGQIPSSKSYPDEVVADGKNVYWSVSNQVLRCAVGGCSGAPTVLANEIGDRLYQDSTALYWGNSLGIRKLAK